jgi:dihydrofolate reductase
MVGAQISISLDGYVAGPNPSLEHPLGEGGELLHEWALPLKSFREPHGMEGGETGADDDLFRDWFASTGATVMGRKMFSGGSGPWDDDPNATGWWGDEPPFRGPVFVLTHHTREPLVLGETTFTFVRDGIESAIEQARAAAGEKHVSIGGGAQAIQQALTAGLLDELLIHLVPVLLGGGVRLFEGVAPRRLQRRRSLESPSGVMHLSYAPAGKLLNRY